MIARLIEYKILGVKSLDKEIDLQFYKSTLKAHNSFEKYNLKAIYGINGSGKSAIVKGIQIYKYLMNSLNDKNYNSNDVEEELYDLTNRVIGKISLEFTFLIEDNLNNKSRYVNVYRHRIEITPLKDNNSRKFNIDYEKLSVLDSTRRIDDDNFITLIESRNGNLLQCNFDNKTNDIIHSSTMNLLLRESFYVTISRKLNSRELISDNHKLVEGIDSINIFLKHLRYYIPDSYMQSKNCIVNSVRVKIKDFTKFKEYIQNLYLFLSIFKMNINGIEIDKKIDGDAYICSLIVIYDNYKISIKQESTGIKKLSCLYGTLNEYCKNSIVFIDELDSDLHEVYLEQMMLFFQKNIKGQLIITTHNFNLMKLFKSNKLSIDFLSMDSDVLTWINNGSSNPEKYYREGLIYHNVFNISDCDFYKAFDLDYEEDK